MNDYTEIGIVVGILMVLGLTLFLLLRWAWRKWAPHDRTSAKLILRLVIAYFVIELIARLTEVFRLSSDSAFALRSLYLSPLFFAQQIIIVILAAWLIWKVIPGKNLHAPSGPIDFEARQKQLVAEVFQSSHFLSAFNTVLPTGAADDKHGVDYIPFMLQSIQDRRLSFERRARIFFWATIGTSLLFASIVTAFGYIMLNEDSAGMPRRVHELADAASQLHKQMADANPDKAQKDLVAIHLQISIILQQASPPPPRRQDHEKLVKDFQAATSAEDMTRLLAEASNTLSSFDTTNRSYQSDLNSAQNILSKYAANYRNAESQLPQTLKDIDSVLADAKKKRDEDKSAFAEIIRRVAIGLVVGTFFFAMIRYLAGLYRKDDDEVRRAYLDDLALRRFYVAYKSSEGRPVDRSKALAFLMVPNGEAPKETDDALGLSKAEADLVKELLGSLAKKVG